MSDDLNNKGQQDRSRINLQEDHEVRYWTQTLGLTKDELQRIVEKVGSSATAVRKELGQ